MRTAAADGGRPAGAAAGLLAALAAAAAEQQGGAGRARVGLCVLCGLPAAGKSTLARALRRRLPQRPGWACAVLSYDELIPPEAFGPPEAEAGAGPAGPSPLRHGARGGRCQAARRVPRAGPPRPAPQRCRCRRGGAWGGRAAVGEPGRVRGPSPLRCLPPQLPRWKRSRRELLQCLECFLRALVAGEPLSAPASATQPAWGRFLAWCQGQGLLSSAESAGAGRRWTRAATSRPLCVILDDNFYYQSMRYEVYQLARKYSLSFCQLFLECPLECCLQRNRLRSHPLPDQTIYLMARKIEMPDLKKNSWEQNSLILKSSDCTSEDNEQIISLLATALENPVKQNEENTEQKEADRAICAASTVHQADQTCRRIISQTMKDAKGTCSVFQVLAGNDGSMVHCTIFDFEDQANNKPSVDFI
ncbi:hypothetical protein QYF61_009444 [Mycteria americana]|uniref:L-seryl-tRNA(Sec) kinase n=1 Tax=Mycteria americana TaxID=33587 RepID=A0AAN7N3C8_MYCAM|nr:hypothetical protein QYF61_009444 [Mycteria americana]